MSDAPFQHPGPPPERPEVPEGVTPSPVPPAPAGPRDLSAFAWWTPFAAAAVALMATFVVVGLISVVYEAGGGRISGEELPPGILIAGTIVQGFAIVAAAVLFAGVTGGVRPTAAAFGLRRTRFWRALGLTVAVTFAYYVLAYAYFAVFDVTQNDDLPGKLGAKESTLNFVAVAFMVCMVAPLAEELFFRGFCFPALSTLMGWVGGAVVSGCIFGAIHISGTDAELIPPLMILGVLLCVLYKVTGSILPCIGLHAFNNGAALSLYMDFEAWGWAVMLLGAPALCIAVALPLTRRVRPALA